MANENISNVLLRLLVDNKEFAEGLKNALQLVAISSKQIKDLMEFKIAAPDFTAMDLALQANQTQLATLLTAERKDTDATKGLGDEKKRAGQATQEFSGFMQKAFFTIQGGISVYNLLKSTIGSMIREANEGAISQNKLTFATRDMEAAAPGAAQRLSEYAATLRDKTGFEKDSIVTAEANLAATFKEEDAVKRLIPLILDITAFKKSQGEAGADLTSVSLAITRAVQGEEGALSRMGIRLDENIVKSRDVNAIVNELTRTYGGFAGQQDKNVVAQAVFNDKLKETKESIGNILNQALTPVLVPLGEMLQNFTELPAPIQSTTIAIGGLTVALIALNTGLGGIPLLIGAVVTALVGFTGFVQSEFPRSVEEVKKAKEELEDLRIAIQNLSKEELDIHTERTKEQIVDLKNKIYELINTPTSVALRSKIADLLGLDDDEYETLTKRLEDLEELLGLLEAKQKTLTPPAVVVDPKQANTLKEIEAAVKSLQTKRETASASEIGNINQEIAALERKRDALLKLGLPEPTKPPVPAGPEAPKEVDEFFKAERTFIELTSRIAVEGIQSKYARQKAEAERQFREDVIQIEETGRTAGRTDEEVTVLKKARGEQLARELSDIEKEETDEVTKKKLDAADERFAFEQILRGDTLAAEIAEIERAYAEAEAKAVTLYTNKVEREKALAQLRKNKENEIANAQFQAAERTFGHIATLISSISTIGRTFGADKFVADMQRALEIVQTIQAIVTAIKIIGSFFGLQSGGFVPELASGGFTGDASADEPVGVVHGGEIVFEEPIVRENKRELLGLRRAMQKGLSLEEILPKFQTGGLVGFNPGIIDFIMHGGATPGTIPIPQNVFDLALSSVGAGVNRVEFDALIDEVRRLGEKIDRGTAETRDLADRININLPEEIVVKQAGRDMIETIKLNQKTDDKRKQ